MPLDRKVRSGVGANGPGAALAALFLAGCMGGVVDPLVTKLGFSPSVDLNPAAAQGVPGGSLDPQAVVPSSLIADLQSRRSILPRLGPLAEVADAVIEASAGAAAAELRVARLKAEARSKNWLPQIGPSINLTSLGGLAASLLVEQVLFDNGRRKAEREFAAADVEIAAVGLSSDINQRVYEGLAHYVRAERARAQAEIAARGVTRLGEYQGIMAQRVEGGLSDRTEQQVISQQFAEMQATLAGDREAELRAMAELAAMSTRPLGGVRGLDSLNSDAGSPEPLSVLRARGEGTIMLAEARIARAGMLPGLSASADVGAGGIETGLRLGTDGFLGFGTGAELKALEATTELADRRAAEAAEDATRKIVALQTEIATLRSREAQGAEVLLQTAENLSMFTEQYKVGRRGLLELVGQFDAFTRLERDQAALRFETVLLQLEIARDRGVLVDGARL